MNARRPGLMPSLIARDELSPQSTARSENAHHNAVFVRNVPRGIDKDFITSLISNCRPLDVQRYDLPGSTDIDVKATIVIIFSRNSHAVQAAQQLSNNELFGVGLVATTGHVSFSPSAPQSQNTSPVNNASKSISFTPPQSRSPPGALPKKNLYIVNIPLDMTENELDGIFSPYGIVNHVCILSTPDVYGRRRAFVDMLSGSAARTAAAAINGKALRNYHLDVSFAHIQRSSTRPGEVSPTFTPHRSPTARQNPFSSPRNSDIPFNPRSSGGSTFSVPPPPYAPRLSRTLLIRNLAPHVAIDSGDLHRLFSEYGVVLNAQLVHAGDEQATGWGQVAFLNAVDAEQARIRLDGRIAGGLPIAVERLDDNWLVKQPGSNAIPARPGRERTMTTGTTSTEADIAPSDSASCVGARDETLPRPIQPTPAQSPIVNTGNWSSYIVGSAAPVSPTVSRGGHAVPLPAPSGDGAWPAITAPRTRSSFESIALGPVEEPMLTARPVSTVPRSLMFEGSASTPRAYIRQDADLAHIDARLSPLAAFRL